MELGLLARELGGCPCLHSSGTRVIGASKHHLSVFTGVLEIQSYVFVLVQLALNPVTHFLGPVFDFINNQNVSPKGQVGLLSSHS